MPGYASPPVRIDAPAFALFPGGPSGTYVDFSAGFGLARVHLAVIFYFPHHLADGAAFDQIDALVDQMPLVISQMPLADGVSDIALVEVAESLPLTVGGIELVTSQFNFEICISHA